MPQDFCVIMNTSKVILIANDLSRHKKLDADPKEIQQREFVPQLLRLDNNDNAADADAYQNMFVLKILEKVKKDD